MEVSVSSLHQRLGELDPSSRECIEILQHIVSESRHTHLISSLEKHILLEFIEILDKAMDSIYADDQFRENALPVLRKLCSKTGQLPSSYTLTSKPSRMGGAPFASGGFGDVWKGLYLGRLVAIKRLRIYESFTAEQMDKMRKAFCKEVVTWKRLSHPNIVPFLGVSPSLPLFAMVSVWMPNGNVRQYVDLKSAPTRLRLLVDIANGLGYLHYHKIVHGDLKGENILIDDMGRACLCDFGLASFSNMFNISTSDAGSCGTTRWMAPELYDTGEGYQIPPPSNAIDIYAFSMVAIEVFTGKLPLHRFGKEAVLFQTVKGVRPTRPDAPGLGLTDNVWELIKQCWRENPDLRPIITDVQQRLITAHQELCLEYFTQPGHISKEFVHELGHFLSSKHGDVGHEFLLQLHGEDAQKFVDVLDQAIISSYADDILRKNGLSFLRQICLRSGRFPSSYILSEELTRLNDRPFAASNSGDVWKGLYIGQHVAIKFQKVNSDVDPEIVKKGFCHEIVTWKRLSHQNIVRFIGVCMSPLPCMVSEWMPHGNVRDYVRANPKTSRLQLLTDIANGLSYLHSHDIVYGGLKGDNVLIDDNRRARLCNFGQVSLTATLNVSASIPQSHGTFPWLAPELFTNQDDEPTFPTFASDIYAFAVVVMEVFTGSIPFHESSNVSPILEVTPLIRPKRPQNSTEFGLSDSMWDMIQKCWHHDHKERPNIVIVLERFCQVSNSPKSIANTQPTSRPSSAHNGMFPGVQQPSTPDSDDLDVEFSDELVRRPASGQWELTSRTDLRTSPRSGHRISIYSAANVGRSIQIVNHVGQSNSPRMPPTARSGTRARADETHLTPPREVPSQSSSEITDAKDAMNKSFELENRHHSRWKKLSRLICCSPVDDAG